MATAPPTELTSSNTAGKRLGAALAVISAAQLMIVLDKTHPCANTDEVSWT